MTLPVEKHCSIIINGFQASFSVCEITYACYILLVWQDFFLCIFQLSEVPDCSLLYSDYLPELSRHLTGYLEEELPSGWVSCVELQDMDLPSFRPAFLVLCRVLLNVIHECLKLRLEQRPAGKPSLLSIKQVQIIMK